MLMHHSFFNRKNEPLIKRIVSIFGTSIFIGIGIEIIQGMVIFNRTFDQLDILANGIGTFFGFVIIEKINLKKLNIW
jgi:glycopeptide antibiotics resistance protein